MKVKKITVKNLKSISEMTADFNGCTAIITGGNNKGKSTFLKTFVDRVRGDKPSEVVKKGEKDGYCEYELTDGSKFIWEMNGKTEKLSYVTKDGIEIKSGVIKDLGKKFFGEGFDIDSFLNSQPKKQKQILQKVLGIDLEEIDERYKVAYDERTEKNTIYKNEKSKADGLTNTVFNGDLKRINLSSLQSKLVEAEKHNQNYDYVVSGISRKENEIKEIEDEIKKLQEKKDTLNGEIEKGNNYIKDNDKKDIDLIKKEIEDGVKNNELIDANEYTTKQLENVEITKKERDEANEKVKKIEEERTKLLQSVNMPEGFEFTDEGLLYNGFELDKKQLSSSSIYIASLKLASMGLGEIKTLCFDASYLDKDNLEKIEKWANEKGFQLLIERPDYDGGDLKYEIIS